MARLQQYGDPNLMTNYGKITEDIEVIGFYEREYYVFSNFSSFMVRWRDHDWMTSEHAYHSEKFYGTEPELYETLKSMRSAHDALKFAQPHKPERRKDWDDVKRDIMKNICRAKLAQHAYIQKKLLDTGVVVPVEDSPVDEYWGWGADTNGRSELGAIWMELREELRNGQIAKL